MMTLRADSAAAFLDAEVPGLLGLARLAVAAAALAASFLLLERWLMWACRLPAESYFEPVISVELAHALARRWKAALAFAALVALRGRLLWRPWTELDHGHALRWFVAGLALAFAWAFSSYEPNLYFGRTHAIDRALLVAFAALVIWRPVFLLGFLPLLLAIAWQFDHPLGGFSWTDKSAPLRVLLLFLAWFLWLATTGARRTRVFLFTACCLVAAHYWIPGLEKLQLGWLAHGRLHHLTLAAWENGWLASLSPAEIAAFARSLARTEPLAMGFTIAAEAGALLFLWRRDVALALLGAWVFLHAGIFARGAARRRCGRAPREPAYAGQGPIARLLIDRVTTLWDGERLHELRVERVRELAIDAGA